MNEPAILDALDVARLPSPPSIAVQILKLAQDPDAGLSEMAEVLEMDPALSAQVLRICNSAAYRRGRQITSVRQAVTVLGAKTVSIVALGFSLRAAVPNWQHTSGLSDTDLWRQTVATAVTARSLARLKRLNEIDGAFLCGLLSRIGQLLLFSVLPEDYGRVLQAADGEIPTSQQELEILGITHQQAGALLLQRWGLPDLFVQVVRTWDHGPGAEPSDTQWHAEGRQIVAVVEVSDAAAKLLFHADKADLLTQFYEKSQRTLGLSAGEVDRMFRASGDEIAETLAVFDIALDETIDCELILEQARQQLVSVSLGLAADLTAARDNTFNLLKQNEQLAKASVSDSLTGLYNRAGLDRELADLEAARHGTANPLPYSIVMVDLDHFKTVNDNYGHPAGDRVLKSVGESLTQSARATDFVARYGGEEFAVVLTNAGKAEAAGVAERFRASIENKPIELADRILEVTASVGVASSDAFSGEVSFEEVLRAADEALYAAKRSGRNRVVIYHDDSAAHTGR